MEIDDDYDDDHDYYKGEVDEYMTPIIKHLPCLVVDKETPYYVYGIMTEIEKIDHIDYYLSYDYRIEIDHSGRYIIDDIREKFKGEKAQSYNHLEFMKMIDGIKDMKGVRKYLINLLFTNGEI